LQRRYPHELSGGQRQRVVVALALACGASLLLADEPMTGLDLATQTGLLRLLDRLRDQRNLGMLMVSHDLNALMRHCDRLAVMYAGRVVEAAPTGALATEARHPYSRGLLASVASVDDAADWATVPGNPPDLTEPPNGCAFVTRCPLALARCHIDDPHPATLGQSTVACHRGNETTDLGYPAMPTRQTTQGTDPIVEARGLTVVFGSGASTVVALHRVDLTVARSEVVGLVGESGSGKSTLARVLLGLLPPGEGTVRIDGIDLDHATRDVTRGLRRRIGFVHQDPYGSLHPGMTVADLVAEPLVIARVPKDEHPGLVAAALASAGLEPTETLNRYPGRLSGGQRQRVAIARAIVGDPVLLVCDEATAMLDVSTRAGVARTIRQLADERGVATVFVTHDLGEAAHVCDRILVLRAGEVVDSGPTRSVLASPTSHYTRSLFHHAQRGG
jgi:oligopeptide/dipeptide ABC transporter ATP-binding protein